jgi:hypothetical protein
MPYPPLPSALQFMKEDLQRLKALRRQSPALAKPEFQRLKSILTPLQLRQMHDYIASVRDWRKNKPPVITPSG